MPHHFRLAPVALLAALVLAAGCDSQTEEPDPLPSIVGMEVRVQGLNAQGAPFGPEQAVRFRLDGQVFVPEQGTERVVFIEGRDYEGRVTLFGEIEGEPADVMEILRRNKERIEIDYRPVQSVVNKLFFERDLDANRRPVGLEYDLLVERVSNTLEGIVRVEFRQYRTAADKQSGAAPVAALPTAFLPVAILDVDGF